MIRLQSTIVPIFATLAAAALAGVLLTSDGSGGRSNSTSNSPSGPAAPPAGALQRDLQIDLQPLQTAQSLAPLAATSDERPYAQEAMRLADHEVDLAFAFALRAATAHSVPTDPRIRAVQERLQKAQALVAADQARIAELTAQAAKATGAAADALNERIELHKSALELDQDEAEDAQEDLVRAGGDPKAQIQKMVDEHEASHNAGAPAAAQTVSSYRGLAGKIQDLIRVMQKDRQIHAAQREAEARTSLLTARHVAAQKQIDAERSQLPELANRSASTPTLAASSDRSAALVSGAKQLALGQQGLTSLSKRISDIAQLAAAYYHWGEVARAQRRQAIRSVLLGVFWIALTIVFLHYLRLWLDRLGARFVTDPRLQASLRTIVSTAVDLVGLVAVILLLFGPPSQIATALGLIGAGLTVALKDFVVGFAGWFILMGRNGIRVGDWVEIDEIRGEVAEIGLFRTVLLETGNWTESGHPTGRRVSLSNSFAIEGHFFNFTTSGQWLWDEIKATLPADRDPNPIAEAIRKRVTEQTAETARLAEQEWSSLAGSSAMRAFTAEPAVSLRPEQEGMEVVVRYVTRATERHQMRMRLYQEVVDAIREEKPGSGSV
jgi:small-conductance mechanosensitive channel